MRFALVTKVFVLETSTLKAHVQTSTPQATHVDTSDFKGDLLSKLLLTGTHLRKRAVSTLSYSPASIYATPTSYVRNSVLCGLNGLQVDKLIEKTINELLLPLLAACTTLVSVQGVE